MGLDLKDLSSFLQPTCTPDVTGYSFISEGSMRDWKLGEGGIQSCTTHKPDGEMLGKNYNTPQVNLY